MTRRNLVLMSALLSFMLLFSAIGFASLTNTLNIDGSAVIEGKPFEGIYISDISVHSISGVTVSEFDKIHPTLIDTIIIARSGGSMTFKVTVHNNTDITYWYLGQRIDRTVENNGLIGSSGGITVITKDHATDSSQTFNSDDWVPS